MKKYLFFLAAGALAMTACTSEDVVDDVVTGRNTIKFQPVVNKPTKASDLTMGNLSQFKVYGFYTMPENPNKAHSVFDNVTVSNAGTGIWKYDDAFTSTWVKGATYYFYAYSCGSANELSQAFGEFKLDIDDAASGSGMAIGDRTLEIDNYICDNTHQHDLIFASNTGYVGKDASNDAVSLNFKHVLSKLQANFVSKFKPEYEVIIKNVSIRNIRNEGDYKFNSGWANVTRTEGSPLVYLLEPKMENDVNINTISVFNKMVGDNQMVAYTNTAYAIPFDYSAANVNMFFEVDVKYGNDYVIRNVPLTATFAPKWQDGYSYMYNIVVSPESLKMQKIEFTVQSILDWDLPTPNSTDLKVD